MGHKGHTREGPCRRASKRAPVLPTFPPRRALAASEVPLYSRPMSLDALNDTDFLEDETFLDIDAPEARIRGRELYRCTFERAKLAGATLAGCTLERCTFVDCDLTRVSFADTSLQGVRFERCKLLGVDFSTLRANPDVTFEGCLLRYAAFADLNLRGIRFVDCELGEAQFNDCTLVNADFPGSDLAGASFTRCDLAGADLSTANGVFLDARQNNLKDAFIPLETAVLLAQAQGMKVAGFDKPPTRKRR